MNVVKMALESCKEKQSTRRSLDRSIVAARELMDRVPEAFELLSKIGSMAEESGPLKKQYHTDCIGITSGEHDFGVLKIRTNELGELTGARIYPDGLPADGES